ncbi:epoxyqueuosine reductase [Halanaerobacter jeridensis]|uniref:Epoxyqueuosine reductase QueG n=1 Tax=Halanaerobacter jeridensis TaxID=706427 RepID=A0A939BP53_9FIRM|nr:epoxyqueuosine reductase [Halanaerobacter jeridensis]MBM7556552.1 epoxyqueuosine reductase QueG [Halanaerobacter jeridensis]
MNDKLNHLIKDYVSNYKDLKDTETDWRDPVIGIADADDPMFLELKEVISSSHALPTDFIDDAKSVIVFFLPFEEEVVKSNIQDKQSSKKWDYAKIETNNLIEDLIDYMQAEIEKMGYKATSSKDLPPTYNYDEEELISDWSHRHVGYITGMGTFGINNMFITDQGSCGRMGSIVTNLSLKPTERDDQENCLYKYNGKCKVCVDRCVVNAISTENKDGFVDREKCYEHIYEDPPEYSKGVGDACGKCKSGVPCSTTNPVKELIKKDN